MSFLLVCITLVTSISSVYAKGEEKDAGSIYSLTISETEGGKVRVNGQSEQYFHTGDQVQLEILPESGYEIKEIQTEDLKEKIDVTNSSNVTFEMPSNKVHLKPVFRKTKVSEKNPDEKESMDQEPAKDLKADERREQKMKQILKEIGVGFAEESEVATFDLARAAGETINTGAVKKNIGQIDVVDYNTSDWKFLMTWKEGKLGNTSTGEEKM